MPPRKKKEPVQGYNVFQCQLCADKPEFEAKDYPTHMRETHQLDSSAKYQKRMMRHLDATDWFESVYEWLKDDQLFAIQSIRTPRHDKGYWS